MGRQRADEALQAARRWRAIAFVMVLLLGAPFSGGAVPSAHAGWLSKIGRLADDAGGVGGSAVRHGIGAIDNLGGALARHLKTLPGDSAKGTSALAAHATPEGHWRFANAHGEVFTAAGAAEMERALATLLPDRPPGSIKLDLYLSEDTVFHAPHLVKGLPGDANLHLLTGKQAYKLTRLAGDLPRFAAEIRPHLSLRLADRAVFEEAVWQLSRPLNKSNMRVVSLEPGGAAVIPSVPRIDPATKGAMIDRVDPWKLPQALKSLRGQTLVVTGRVEGKTLRFKPEGGAEKTVLVDDLMAAARDADVNLVLLQSDKALQPGGRNWLWQAQEVEGLNEALQRSTLADFLDSLGAQRGGLSVDASVTASGRARLDIVPGSSAAEPVSQVIGNWAGDLVSQMLGKVVIEAIKIDAVDKNRQEELDLRIVPGIPAAVQWTYLAGILMGLIGHAYSFSWWARVWPPEDREEYANRRGFYAARGVRLLALLFLFLPVVGIPAGLWAMLVGFAQQVWMVVTAPFRFLRWIAGKLRPAGG